MVEMEKNKIKYIKIPEPPIFGNLYFKKDGNDPFMRYRARINGLDCGPISIIYGFGAYGEGPVTDQYEVWMMDEWEDPMGYVSSEKIEKIWEEEWIKTLDNLISKHKK